MSLDAPEHAESPAGHTVHTIPRRYVALGLIVLAIILVAVLVVIRNANQTNDTSDVETITPAPTSLVTALAHIPGATSAAVGVTSPTNPITAPTATDNAPLWEAATSTSGLRPVVFFYGAEFAPYAAAERWPLVVALSRFGTFEELGLMQSSSSIAFSDTPTFTFWHVTYSSIWVNLQTVERYSSLNPTGAGYMALQTPTARQSASVAIYDTSTKTFPLLDIANHYVQVGSSFSPTVLDGVSQSQIADDLAYPTSPITQAIVASANEITAGICSVTGQRPTAVCTGRGVLAADAKMNIRTAG
jgi:Domain of unknown function (DUF929)